jgi:hypothetical protein
VLVRENIHRSKCAGAALAIPSNEIVTPQGAKKTTPLVRPLDALLQNQSAKPETGLRALSQSVGETSGSDATLRYSP